MQDANIVGSKELWDFLDPRSVNYADDKNGGSDSQPGSASSRTSLKKRTKLFANSMSELARDEAGKRLQPIPYGHDNMNCLAQYHSTLTSLLLILCLGEDGEENTHETPFGSICIFSPCLCPFRKW